MKMQQLIPSWRGCRLFVQYSLFVGWIGLSLCVGTAQSSPQTPALMPMPYQVTAMAGDFHIRRKLYIQWNGYRNKLLERAAARFLINLNRRTGIRVIHGNGDHPGDDALVIDCAGPDPGFLTVKQEESYQVNVNSQEIVLKAPGPAGILHGLATLLQLVTTDSGGFGFRAVVIKDQPRFPWRGLMIDVSRHFMPVSVLERQLDAMEAVKLNVLHLHLTDDESFSIESKSFPRLQGKGAVAGKYYSHRDIRQLVAYARDRGIRVVPEFDVPAHVRSWLLGYPRLGPRGGNDVLDPTKGYVYRFLGRFFGEMAALFPDKYVHVGGDEVSGREWSNDPHIQEFMRKHHFQTTDQLQAYFTRRLHKIIQSHHKIMIGWDEVLTPSTPSDVAIEVWHRSHTKTESVESGHVTLVAGPYYLDLLQHAGTYYVNDPMHTDPPAVWNRREKSLMLGGEAAMWTEMTTPEMLDAGVWPRAAAIADRFWSPASVKNVDDMYRRLFVVDRELEILGTQQYANRQRMVDRLAPSDPVPLETFVSVVEPIKGVARWHIAKAGKHPDQNTLADAAFPESLVARRFCHDVDVFLAGDHGGADDGQKIRAMLSQWRNSGVEFDRVASSRELLRVDIPVSRRLSALALVGLQALDTMQTHHPPSKQWVMAERSLLGKQEEIAKGRPQPKSQLVIAIIPGIEKLALAAEKISPQSSGRNVSPDPNR